MARYDRELRSSLYLREKCPNTELFLVRIQENTDEIGGTRRSYWDTLHAVFIWVKNHV